MSPSLALFQEMRCPSLDSSSIKATRGPQWYSGWEEFRRWAVDWTCDRQKLPEVQDAVRHPHLGRRLRREPPSQRRAIVTWGIEVFHVRPLLVGELPAVTDLAEPAASCSTIAGDGTICSLCLRRRHVNWGGSWPVMSGAARSVLLPGLEDRPNWSGRCVKDRRRSGSG